MLENDVEKAHNDTCRDSELEETVARVLTTVQTVEGIEDIPLVNALGRINAAPAIASMPLPAFDQAAVDGYGISTSHLDGTSDVRVSQRVAAGDKAKPIDDGAARVFTGAPIPSGCAAVLAQERCQKCGHRISFEGPVNEGLNIRRRGEDIEPGDTVIDAGTVVDARHIAVAAALGLPTLRVKRRLRIGVLSNGDELRQPGEPLAPSTIYDCNRFMVQALLAAQAGIEIDDLGCLPDDRRRLTQRFHETAASVDLIIVCGGMSVGDEDHVRPAVREAGGDLSFVHLMIKPGKPASFGYLGDTALLGLPGNPFAALVAFLVLGRPLIATLAGATAPGPTGVEASAAFHYSRRAGRTEFAPARVVGKDRWGRPSIDRLGRGGSARLLPLIAADGLVRIPADLDDIKPGSNVRFYSLNNLFGW